MNNRRTTLENLETCVNVGLKLTKASSVASLGIGAVTIASAAWIGSQHGTLPKPKYLKAKEFVEAGKSASKAAIITSLFLGGFTIAASYLEDRYINKNKKERNNE